MYRLVTFLLLLLLSQSALAQVLLRAEQGSADRYIVQFVTAGEVSELMRHGDRASALRRLRERQLGHRKALLRDLAGSDLEIRHDLWLRQAVAVTVSARHVAAIEILDYVLSVTPERRYRAEPQSIVSLPLSAEIVQDNLDHIDIDALWSEHYRGQGTVVAIIDSGVDPLHLDLEEQWRGGTNSWFDPYDQQDSPRDLTGHGTAVASIVLGGNSGGSYLGVAPHAQWIGARIFDDFGNSTEGAISAALQWVLDPDGNAATDDFPDVVQNSWGLDASEGSCVNPFSAELAAIDAFGIDQVFAVGNSGLSGPGPGGFSSFLTPAFDAHVISVGATRDDDTLMFNSSRGPDICGSAIIPSLVAPGDLIKTAELTFDGFDSGNTTVNSGTSYSSPHVSGALLLLRSKFDAADHLRYRQSLYDNAIALGAQPDYGRGLVQASAAAAALAGDMIPLRANEVAFSNSRYRFRENQSDARIEIIRSGDLNTAASVDIASIDGSAVAPADYQAIQATISFDPGEAIKSVELFLADDDTGENLESMQLRLSQNIAVNLGAGSSITVLIEDDDNPSTDEDEIGGSSTGLLLSGLMALLIPLRRETA